MFLLEQNTVKPTTVSAQQQKRQRISNEVVKPLLLTLLLHGGLVGLGVWYWQSQPTKLGTTQTPLAKPATKSTQIIASPITTSAVTSHQSTWAVSPLQSLQQISLLFSPYAQTDTSLRTSASTPPSNHATSSKDGKNLSRVATDEHLTPLPPMPASSQVVTVAAPPITQVLTERDIPSPKQTAATTTSKPYLAKTPLDKKVRELTTAIEDDNQQLSELIDQVKKNNQQQINQQTTIE